MIVLKVFSRPAVTTNSPVSLPDKHPRVVADVRVILFRSDAEPVSFRCCCGPDRPQRYSFGLRKNNRETT